MVGKRRKKALHKDFWQEIRKSRARFISIFCIVALGVAFFSGIQASSPDMRLSGDDYYNEVGARSKRKQQAGSLMKIKQALESESCRKQDGARYES